MKLIFLVVLSLMADYAFSCNDCGDNGNSNGVGKQWVDAHNSYRRKKGIRDVIWDERVAKTAQAWADHLASRCGGLYHDDSSGYGENIAGAWGYSEMKSPKEVTQMWGKEEQWYNYATNKCASGKVCGHYKQIVWAKSTAIGCGSAYKICQVKNGRSQKKYYFVCRYDPAGNFVGQKPY